MPATKDDIPTRLDESGAYLENVLIKQRKTAEYKIDKNIIEFNNIVDHQLNELSEGGIKVINDLFNNDKVLFYIIKEVLREKLKITLIKKNEGGYTSEINKYDPGMMIYAIKLKIGGKSRKSRRVKRVTKCKRNCRKSRRVKRVTKCKRNCGKSRRVRKSKSKQVKRSRRRMTG